MWRRSPRSIPPHRSSRSPSWDRWRRRSTSTRPPAAHRLCKGFPRQPLHKSSWRWGSGLGAPTREGTPKHATGTGACPSLLRASESAFVAPSRVKRPPPRPPAPRTELCGGSLGGEDYPLHLDAVAARGNHAAVLASQRQLQSLHPVEPQPVSATAPPRRRSHPIIPLAGESLREQYASSKGEGGERQGRL